MKNSKTCFFPCIYSRIGLLLNMHNKPNKLFNILNISLEKNLWDLAEFLKRFFTKLNATALVFSD